MVIFPDKDIYRQRASSLCKTFPKKILVLQQYQALWYAYNFYLNYYKFPSSFDEETSSHFR